jgi:hypothetical protein
MAQETYRYDSFRCMKKTLDIDETMLLQPKECSGAATDTETVRLGLEALIRQAALQRLRKFRGSEQDAADVPRLRGEATRKKKTAA